MLIRRSSLARLSSLLLALAGTEALTACSDEPAPSTPSSSSTTGGGGGAGGSAGDGGNGGNGGNGGFAWPVDTYPVPITPSADWKNQITFPIDPFLTWPTGGNLDQGPWVKFTVLMHDPTKVYFQDSTKYLFHGEFATQRLDPFVGMTIAQFDDASLHEEGQEAILGAVLFSPRPGSVPEYGVQLVRKDAYAPEMARVVLDLVKKSIVAPAGVKSFYFPTYEQSASASMNEGFFEASGFPVSSAERWLEGDACYSTGWALGRLRYVPPDQIDAAYAAGELKAEDILLTDSVPAEVPYVAGIVSLSPSTPNAHTAILATSFGIPFVYLSGAQQKQRAMELADQDVVLRAANEYESFCKTTLFDVTGEISPADRDALLTLKKPPKLAVEVKKPLGAFSASTDALGPADSVYFGGKASNHGLLRDAIPNNTDAAIGLSFDLWDGFLDQAMPGGKPLRAEIDEKLAGYAYPPDLLALRVDLKAIRDRITVDTVFSSAQEQAVEAALAGFDPKRKIRFRSSTNMEDSAVFTGAGLYDSYSGCLADDTDADAAGPSLCDPTEESERGVYRAIRKVYASFYNDNAFLARLLYGVKEADVGMGMLVHHSYPDEDEMANGVATLARASSPTDDIKLVSQLGAASVTNPEGFALPEVVRLAKWSSGTEVSLTEPSSLVPLGGHVMKWDDDYRDLATLLGLVADRFAQVNPGKPTFLLDYEFKKMKPGELVVKQMREVARPDTTPTLTPFLVNDPRELCTFQGETGDVFGNHRLKARVSVATKSAWLTPATLGETLFTDATMSYASFGAVKALSGSPAAFPGAAHALDADTAKDLFTDGAGQASRTITIATSPIPALLPPSQGPIVALRDFGVALTADYAAPVPIISWDGTPGETLQDFALLKECPKGGAPPDGALLVQRTFTGPSGVTVKTSFYWPPPPTGIVAGYTAPLLQWVETTILGLTQSPLVLKGYFSQTYRPEHHNFAENFLFEPAFEEGIAPALVAELDAKGIRQIYVSGDEQSVKMATVSGAGVVQVLK